MSPRLVLLPALLALFCATPARAQTPDAPPASPNAVSPSSPEMKKGPATEVVDEEDPDALAVNFELDTRSRYLFRGIALSEGFVVQPTLSLAKRGTTFSVFGNLNASRKSGPLQGPRQLNELDYTLSQTFKLGQTTIAPGFVVYDYPTGVFDRTGEVSLSLSHPLQNVNLFFNSSLDVVKYQGAYFGEVGVSGERKLGARTVGEATLSLGFANDKFNEANIGPKKSAFNVLALGTSLTYQLSDKLYVRPHLNFSRILDSTLREALDAPTILEGGVALGFDF